MKNLAKNPLKIVLLIFSFSMLYSCGGGNGNTGSNVTEIDSIEDTAAVGQNRQIDERLDFDPDNWVKVDFDENSNFDWEEFKDKFQAGAEAIGEGFRVDDDEITSSWESLNDDYSYQTVYRYRDNGLWMQTYYRKNNGLSEAEAVREEDRKLLTRDDAQDSELKELWEKMEESARSLKDSIF